jgi:glucose/arabinose dehydrogenase
VRILHLLLIAALTVCDVPQEPLASTPPELKMEVFVRGLNTPWAIGFAPDNRIFITERPGRVSPKDDDDRVIRLTLK